MKIYWTCCVQLKINLLSAFGKTLKRALRSVTDTFWKHIVISSEAYDMQKDVSGCFLVIHFVYSDQIFFPDCGFKREAGVLCQWDGGLSGGWKFCPHCGLHSDERRFLTLPRHLHHHSGAAPRDRQVSLMFSAMVYKLTVELCPFASIFLSSLFVRSFGTAFFEKHLLSSCDSEAKWKWCFLKGWYRINESDLGSRVHTFYP